MVPEVLVCVSARPDQEGGRKVADKWPMLNPSGPFKNREKGIRENCI